MLMHLMHVSILSSLCSSPPSLPSSPSAGGRNCNRYNFYIYLNNNQVNLIEFFIITLMKKTVRMMITISMIIYNAREHT